MAFKELDYPIDSSYILRKKKLIKRQLLEQDFRINKNIAILGGSTTAEIKDVLELFLLSQSIKPNFYESGYDKYYEDAVFENANLKAFNPDIIYIHTSFVNITKFPLPQDSEEDVEIIITNETEKFKVIWDSLSNYDCAIIQNNFELPYYRCLGNLDFYDYHGKTNFITRLNIEFAKYAGIIKNLYINDINYLSAEFGLKNWYDLSLWMSSKYALSFDSIPLLAFNLSKIISAIFGNTKKCLVLDLDNTCWGGVIGDDGLGGIKIGTETAISESFTYFQRYVKELKQRGIAMAVSSKNNLENAKEGFKHPDSVLQFDDFTSFKANWDPKHQNIKEIAKELNIGLDSIVFIDDNPMERDLVSSQLPEVSVPNVGSEVINFINYIDKNGYFEAIFLSNEDLNRNKYFEDNKKRKLVQQAFVSYDEFLLSLNMSAEIRNFSPIYIDRITQLINKTNQFNLTSRRYTLGEVNDLANNSQFITLYGKLTDKYGNNGLISILIGKVVKKQCHIDLWLMSCRVLNRNMEFAMFDSLVEQCKNHEITEIFGYYIKTEKNVIVANLFFDLGFKLVEMDKNKTVYNLKLDNYLNKNTLIRITND